MLRKISRYAAFFQGQASVVNCRRGTAFNTDALLYGMFFWKEINAEIAEFLLTAEGYEEMRWSGTLSNLWSHFCMLNSIDGHLNGL